MALARWLPEMPAFMSLLLVCDITTGRMHINLPHPCTLQAYISVSWATMASKTTTRVPYSAAFWSEECISTPYGETKDVGQSPPPHPHKGNKGYVDPSNCTGCSWYGEVEEIVQSKPHEQIGGMKGAGKEKRGKNYLPQTSIISLNMPWASVKPPKLAQCGPSESSMTKETPKKTKRKSSAFWMELDHPQQKQTWSPYNIRNLNNWKCIQL